MGKCKKCGNPVKGHGRPWGKGCTRLPTARKLKIQSLAPGQQADTGKVAKTSQHLQEREGGRPLEVEAEGHIHKGDGAEGGPQEVSFNRKT